MVHSDPLDIAIDVYDDYVVYVATKIRNSEKSARLMAADPKFFVKLEKVIRREEKYCHFAKIVWLLCSVTDNVWGILLQTVVPWVIEKIDGIESAWLRYKLKRRVRKEILKFKVTKDYWGCE